MGYEDEYPEDSKHEALRNYSRTATQAKHVMGGGFKGGLIGAGIGGALAGGAVAAITAGAIVATGPIGMALGALGLYTGVGTGMVTAAVGSAALTGAMYGGAVGAGAGGLMAVTSASDAADAEEERIINRYEQAQARQDRLARLREARDRQMVAMERQEMMMRGQNLNQGLPRRGPQPGGPAYI